LFLSGNDSEVIFSDQMNEKFTQVLILKEDEGASIQHTTMLAERKGNNIRQSQIQIVRK